MFCFVCLKKKREKKLHHLLYCIFKPLNCVHCLFDIIKQEVAQSRPPVNAS